MANGNVEEERVIRGVRTIRILVRDIEVTNAFSIGVCIVLAV